MTKNPILIVNISVLIKTPKSLFFSRFFSWLEPFFTQNWQCSILRAAPQILCRRMLRQLQSKHRLWRKSQATSRPQFFFVRKCAHHQRSYYRCRYSVSTPFSHRLSNCRVVSLTCTRLINIEKFILFFMYCLTCLFGPKKVAFEITPPPPPP